MSDLFNTSLSQWFSLETAAVKAAEAVKDNKEDIEFYAQLVHCSSKQAETACPADRLSEIRYMKTQVLRLEELLELKPVLEERAHRARERADAWKAGLREVANF